MYFKKRIVFICITCVSSVTNYTGSKYHKTHVYVHCNHGTIKYIYMYVQIIKANGFQNCVIIQDQKGGNTRQTKE